MEATTQLAIQEGYIEHIKKILDAFSTAYPSFSTVTRVIKDVQNGVRPDYPYIAVTKVSSALEGSWLRESFVDTDDKVTYVSEQKVYVNVSCYGDGSGDILNTLRATAVDDLIRLDLNTLTGARFQYYTSIDETPQFLETDFIEGATLSCYFTMMTIWKQFNPFETGIIEGVEGDNEVKDFSDDADPIIVPINTTN